MRRIGIFLAAFAVLIALVPRAAFAGHSTVTRPSIPYSGSWTFAVPPVREARGYLWSFVQDGVIRWQNLTFEHSLSGRTYTIARGSTAHRHLHPGTLWVWVQALLPHGRWSRVTTLTVVLRTPPPATMTPVPPHPTATSVPPASTPTPAPTATPSHPGPGTVLYQADDKSGTLDKWVGSPDLSHLNGTLTNDGSNKDSRIAVPYEVQGTNDYAVEVQLQVVKPPYDGQFGIRVRNSSKGGYNGAITYDCCPSVDARITATDESQGFDPGTDWHTYRVEVQGNTIRFLVDGSPLLTTQDNRFLTGRTVGLWSNGVQLTVRSVTITAL